MRAVQKDLSTEPAMTLNIVKCGSKTDTKKKKKPINQTGKQKGTLGTSRVQLSDRRTLNDLDSEVSGLGSDV